MSKKNYIPVLLAIFTLVAVSCVCFAQGGGGGSWSPSDYAAENGECWIPAKGDPLYDEHYAKNVNNPNCRAFVLQQQGEWLGAQTQQTQQQTVALRWELFMEKVGIYGFFGVLVLIVILMAIAIARP